MARGPTAEIPATVARRARMWQVRRVMRVFATAYGRHPRAIHLTNRRAAARLGRLWGFLGVVLGGVLLAPDREAAVVVWWPHRRRQAIARAEAAGIVAFALWIAFAQVVAAVVWWTTTVAVFVVALLIVRDGRRILRSTRGGGPAWVSDCPSIIGLAAMKPGAADSFVTALLAWVDERAGVELYTVAATTAHMRLTAN